DLALALALSTLSISVYAIIQKFTGWGIATPEWASEATRRVTAFFSSPNAVGLYLAPVAMLLLLMIWKKSKERGLIFWLLNIVCLLSLAAIFFTKSQGTWVGLAVGVLVFLFFVGYKKVALAAAVLGIIFSLALPSMRQALLFKDQANQNRLRLWGYSWTFLSQSPKNFILGAGVRQFFRKVQKPYYDKIVMERLIYPHNIFLNFWTEIGLPGMLAAITMLGYVFYLANKIRKSDKLIGAGLLGALTVLVVHGLVDVPYFKNDLAFLFWIIMIIPFYYKQEYDNIYQSQTDVVRGKS
ncbi:MAG: O-antigen ligase family protein, partial [Patescibacteria group bacterium]